MKLTNSPKQINIPNGHPCKSDILNKTRTEIDYYLIALEKLKFLTIGNSHNSLKVAEFVGEFKRYKAILKRLCGELEGREHENASYGTLCLDLLTDPELFQKELNDLERDYSQQKNSFQIFMASLDGLSKKM